MSEHRAGKDKEISMTSEQSGMFFHEAIKKGQKAVWEAWLLRGGLKACIRSGNI